MAGAAATKVEKKSRTGDGIMLSDKWKNHKNKKKTTQETEKKKRKDRLRYLLKKLAKDSICPHEKRELKLLKEILTT